MIHDSLRRILPGSDIFLGAGVPRRNELYVIRFIWDVVVIQRKSATLDVLQLMVFQGECRAYGKRRRELVTSAVKNSILRIRAVAKIHQTQRKSRFKWNDDKIIPTSEENKSSTRSFVSHFVMIFIMCIAQFCPIQYRTEYHRSEL